MASVSMMHGRKLLSQKTALRSVAMPQPAFVTTITTTIAWAAGSSTTGHAQPVSSNPESRMIGKEHLGVAETVGRSFDLLKPFD